MAFWSSEKLAARIEAENLVSPFDVEAIKSAAYELSLGDEYFLTSDQDNTKDRLENHDQVSIPPGQFGLLISEEVVKVPLDAIAFISIKAGVKFRGLVNVSGFHVDPGFTGKLKFSVFNAGGQPVVLQRNQRVFLIWYADLDQMTAGAYSGAHQNQSQITGEDVMRIQGEIASPATLAKRITELEGQFRVWSGVLLTVFLTFLGISLKNCSEAGAANAKTGTLNSECCALHCKAPDNEGAIDTSNSAKPNKQPASDSGTGGSKAQRVR